MFIGGFSNLDQMLDDIMPWELFDILRLILECSSARQLATRERGDQLPGIEDLAPGNT